jgi:tetratricopeptide (TPR) repeat protein
MLPRKLIHALVIGSAALRLVPGPVLHAEYSPLIEGWNQAKSFLYKDALETFKGATGRSGTEERERLLGQAVTALNIQPRTQAGILRVKRSLEELTTERADDQVGILARYLTGRIFELHLQPRDPTAAALVYRGLVESYPGNEIAEYAASSLVHIELYQTLTPAERLKRFASLENLGRRLLTPAGKRDFHIALGYAALDLTGQHDAALRHFLTADEAGITRPETESAIWIHIGELARSTQRTDLAAAYYHKFLEKYPRNNASATIRQKLKALRP